jgi:hypothetical protein
MAEDNSLEEVPAQQPKHPGGRPLNSKTWCSSIRQSERTSIPATHTSSVVDGGINQRGETIWLEREIMTEQQPYTMSGFSLSEPKAGAARIRLAENDGSKTFENLHCGARAFADGLYTAIRIPGMHTPAPTRGGEEQIALEQVAAFSLLARWVDQAQVELA